VTNDLLALLVEVTSIGVANRALKKPLEIPRPNRKKDRVSPTASASEKDAAFKAGIGVLAATTRAVRK
jgi:hypothetical protein